MKIDDSQLTIELQLFAQIQRGETSYASRRCTERESKWGFSLMVIEKVKLDMRLSNRN